ncbi:hypothetical protein K435DRAFT_869108 [Dendrothele bispora CBS 962.96]|uniref:Uncharacterized protein n=1 Tax=Dendrothele bispora (strain CBS 962.96) TaxID=1314807 RepID=A0A4S8LAH4_DENBC|nr:hypothetical protein K435DRAFT_869108 [Dendrothele bispora CBS 962.96]
MTFVSSSPSPSSPPTLPAGLQSLTTLGPAPLCTNYDPNTGRASTSPSNLAAAFGALLASELSHEVAMFHLQTATPFFGPPLSFTPHKHHSRTSRLVSSLPPSVTALLTGERRKVRVGGRLGRVWAWIWMFGPVAQVTMDSCHERGLGGRTVIPPCKEIIHDARYFLNGPKTSVVVFRNLYRFELRKEASIATESLGPHFSSTFKAKRYNWPCTRDIAVNLVDRPHGNHQHIGKATIIFGRS